MVSFCNEVERKKGRLITVISIDKWYCNPNYYVLRLYHPFGEI